MVMILLIILLLFSNSDAALNLCRFNESQSPCTGARDHLGYPDSCSYALAHEDCKTGALLEYIEIFYCVSSPSTSAHLRIVKQCLCFIVLALWLLALFYMLASTAADYFCSCLQNLSQLLRLPATVAGVTLLPLGNGAPDVFASIVSFLGHRGAEVGLNSVLGGAVFVVTVVAGLVNILVARQDSDGTIRLDGLCFLRDGIFFAVSLGTLMLVLWRGRVSSWEAAAYLGIYLAYALVVILWEISRARIQSSAQQVDEEKAQQQIPDQGDLKSVITVPSWLWTSHLVMFSQESHENASISPESTENATISPEGAPACQDSHENAPISPKKPPACLDSRENAPMSGDDLTAPLIEKPEDCKMSRRRSFLNLSRKASKILIGVPLALPRQLTIPVVEESRWSKPRATIAATLAPILLVAVWSAENSTPITHDLGFLAGGIFAGMCLGIVAYSTTLDERPPQGYLALTWIIAGFFMSIVWFYVIARELVAALVSLAAVLEVDVGIVGLTVLAWGNSVGDLVANSAMARHGGATGVQIAMSGCYASPMFNTLIGLGISFLIAAVGSEGGVYYIPDAWAGMLTVGFVLVAIATAGVVLGMNGMRPSKWLGSGLIALYFSFMLVRGLGILL